MYIYQVSPINILKGHIRNMEIVLGQKNKNYKFTNLERLLLLDFTVLLICSGPPFGDPRYLSLYDVWAYFWEITTG